MDENGWKEENDCSEGYCIAKGYGHYFIEGCFYTPESYAKICAPLKLLL
jgi:hypothetical protein